jgi:hypothetical protein
MEAKKYTANRRDVLQAWHLLCLTMPPVAAITDVLHSCNIFFNRVVLATLGLLIWSCRPAA